jgi:anaerobic magnesium-protoporphyrin IX monomethyl ester cyclase
VVEPYDATDYPHIGLGYCASYLRSKGLPITVLDAKLEKLSVLDTLERIDTIKPDIVGLTAYTQEITHVACLAHRIKKAYPSIRTVIGGIHATVLPLETLREFPSFDFVVFGEGEATLCELVKALENDQPLEVIKGLGFRRKDDIYINERREWNSKLDELPFPAWDLFPKAKVYPIITSRGCAFKCIFCTRPYGNKIRERSPENVVAEFKEVVTKHKAQNIVFRDETFGANKRRAIKIADMLIQENMSSYVEWNIHTRVNTVDYKLLERLKRAGCTSVGYGVESGNAEVLRMSKKGITLQQAEKAVKISKQLGLRTSSYFILGLPYETKKTAWETINFARKLNTDSVSIAIMIPFPKTEVAEMVAQGRGGYKQISYDWSDYNKQTGAVVELKGMSRRALVFFQIAGYLMCYLYNFHFRSFVGLVKSRFKQVLVLVRNLLSVQAH